MSLTSAKWLCTRAGTWRGPGRVLVHFLRPAASPTAPAAVVADRDDTALCSRFGQHVLAGTRWKAASGRWYVLAAGSRAVSRIEATGQVRGAAGGPTLAVRAPRDASVQLTAGLRGGRDAGGGGLSRRGPGCRRLAPPYGVLVPPLRATGCQTRTGDGSS